MSGDNYNQFVGDVDDLEFLLEEDEEVLIKDKNKTKKKTKSKWFDDGTAVKHNSKKYTRHRETKE